jgi:hypothetical protein
MSKKCKKTDEEEDLRDAFNVIVFFFIQNEKIFQLKQHQNKGF